MSNLPSARYFGSRRRLRDPDVDCRCGLSAEISTAKSVSRRSRARGFTLIEILVSISIIALLVGLSAFGALAVQRGAQRNRVKAMFESLQGAQSSYQAATGKQIDHTVGTPGTSSIERFVIACLSHPDSESTMRGATNGPGVLVGNQIVDPWDTPIIYRTSNGKTGASPDSGVSNADLPISRDPFFVSAGPDGDFGTDDDITSIEIGS